MAGDEHCSECGRRHGPGAHTPGREAGARTGPGTEAGQVPSGGAESTTDGRRDGTAPGGTGSGEADHPGRPGHPGPGGTDPTGGTAAAESGEDDEDPLHIRPYVRLQGPSGPAAGPGGSGEPGAPPVVSAAPAEPPPVPDLTPFAQHGTEETAELPAVSGAVGAGAGPRAHAARRSERRRPGTAVLASVGIAAVLGAGVLTTQILTGGDDSTDEGGRGTALHTATSAPTHALPAPSTSASRTPAETAGPTALPSRSTASATPRAGRDDGSHTRPPSGEPSTSSPASPSSSAPGPGTRPPSTEDGRTLRPGDSGAEVAELQRRLKQAGFYAPDAPEDGVYSSLVQEGVFRYQAYHRIEGDTPGDYGPATRRSLERRTS